MRHLATIVVLLLLSGCTSRWYTDPQFEFDVAGPVAVDVEIFAGDVRIHADPSLRQGLVTVTRESTHGNLRGTEAIDSFEEMGFKVEVVAGDIGRVLQIRAITEHAEPHYHRVNFSIRLPDIEDVTIRTHNGDINVTDARGRIDVATNDGDVSIATRHAMQSPIRVLNDNGDISLRLRGESRGELDFQADGGEVTHRIRFGQTILHPGSDHDTLLASFNSGTNSIVLRTADGDINFAVVAAPLQYQSRR